MWPAGGSARRIRHKIVVLALLLGRHAEAGVSDALRISSSHNVFDDAALARGVHTLQHQEQRAVVLAASAVRVQHLLQVGESLVAFGLQRRRVGLLALEPGVALVSMFATLSPCAEHQIVMWLVRPQVGQIDWFLLIVLSNCGGKIGDGCGISRNFSSDPPTSTMPHSAFQDSIDR